MRAPSLRPSKIRPEQFQAAAQAVMQDLAARGEWSAGVKPHVEYQGRWLEWIIEKLGVPEHMIRWSLNPEYRHCHCNTSICRGGGPHTWDGDRDPLVTALAELGQGHSVAVSSGTTTSKTYTLGACGSLCFLAVYQNSIVMSLAPKQEQLLINMWKEIGKLWPRFKVMFPDAELMTGKLRMRQGEGEKEVWAATAFGAGLGADEEFAQRLKGVHEKHMLWIIEEMPGVEQAKVDTIIKTATAEFNPILGMGQPESQLDTLTSFGRREWVKDIRISALDFPNVVCDREVIPGGRSRWSVERDLADADHDENDAGYLSQVRGVAPEQSARSLIQRRWLDEAVARQGDRSLRNGVLALGVDVADKPTGDKSVVSRWDGAVCTEVEVLQVEDASELGRVVFREMADPDAPVAERHVGVDNVGVGSSTINELKRLGARRVRGLGGNEKAIPMVDVVEAPTEKEDERTDDERRMVAVVESGRYDRQRSQILWRLREDLRLGRIAIPDDRLLFEELLAIQYEERNGKICVEEKAKIKARLRRSPDRADAMAYGNFVRHRQRRIVRQPKEELPADRNADTGLERFIARHNKRMQDQERQFKRNLAARRRERMRGRRT